MAIPGCAGKGVIDLMVVYLPGHLVITRTVLDQMGFQKWEHPLAFPDSRPVRIGSIIHRGKRYRIHTHVIEQGQEEIGRQLAFRNRLRNDASLVRAYEAKKCQVLAQGITFGPEYANAKSDFIQEFSAPD